MGSGGAVEGGGVAELWRRGLRYGAGLQGQLTLTLILTPTLTLTLTLTLNLTLTLTLTP